MNARIEEGDWTKSTNWERKKKKDSHKNELGFKKIKKPDKTCKNLNKFIREGRYDDIDELDDWTT